jgi:hypothetical protein
MSPLFPSALTKMRSVIREVVCNVVPVSSVGGAVCSLYLVLIPKSAQAWFLFFTISFSPNLLAQFSVNYEGHNNYEYQEHPGESAHSRSASIV